MNDLVEVIDATELPKRADLATRDGGAVATVPTEPNVVLGAIVSLAKDPSLNIDVFDRLIAMQERMEDRQAERAFNQAFVRMQGKLPTVKRNGALEYPINKNDPDGPKRKISNYAKWEDIDKAIRPILTQEGFALSFKIGQRAGDGGGLLVSALIRHEGGHSVLGDPIPVPLDTSGGKNNIQAYGSALSYGKRYAAFAALNINTEGADDDAQRAGIEYISAAQVEALVEKMREAGRQEGSFLPRMCTDVRSAEEVETKDYIRVMNALNEIINARTPRA